MKQYKGKLIPLNLRTQNNFCDASFYSTNCNNYKDCENCLFDPKNENLFQEWIKNNKILSGAFLNGILFTVQELVRLDQITIAKNILKTSHYSLNEIKEAQKLSGFENHKIYKLIDELGEENEKT